MTGGLRAAGKTAEEALTRLCDCNRLENAGAFSAESEAICGETMAEGEYQKLLNGIDKI